MLLPSFQTNRSNVGGTSKEVMQFLLCRATSRFSLFRQKCALSRKKGHFLVFEVMAIRLSRLSKNPSISCSSVRGSGMSLPAQTLDPQSRSVSGSVRRPTSVDSSICNLLSLIERLSITTASSLLQLKCTF